MLFQDFCMDFHLCWTPRLFYPVFGMMRASFLLITVNRKTNNLNEVTFFVQYVNTTKENKSKKNTVGLVSFQMKEHLLDVTTWTNEIYQ